MSIREASMAASTAGIVRMSNAIADRREHVSVSRRGNSEGTGGSTRSKMATRI
jgi:hypothetical protein